MRFILAAVSAFVFLAGCTSLAPTAHTYVVFFNAKSVELSPEAKEVVNLAAAAARDTHPALVVIAGEPNTVTAPGYDPKLAEPRFIAVEQALVAAGVDPNTLARAELTDLEAKVGATGDRRVEIRMIKNR
jgi:outer membrane protein OmpA-like peptidoglycan-associated protein